MAFYLACGKCYMTHFNWCCFLPAGDESMPRIKQCYSLHDSREDDVSFAKKSQSKSTSHVVTRTSPVTMTTTASSKGLPSAAVDPGCIVYISKSAAQTPSSSASLPPRAGYLLPVYKPDTREAAYAFLPAGAQLPNRVGDKAGLETRESQRKSDSCTTVASASTHSHPHPHSTKGSKEELIASHPDKAKFALHSQLHSTSYRDTAPQNTRIHSGYESSAGASVTSANPSRTDTVNTNGNLRGNGKNHVINIPHTHEQHSKATACVGNPRISRQDVTGSPLPQDNKNSIAPSDKLHYPAVCRTPEVVPNPAPNTQEGIFNPMALYVRPRLVPREVVSVNHATEPSPPLVEYIKTDAICDKELTKWDAKNVADFIAATDCRDKAELFLEEVCIT